MQNKFLGAMVGSALGDALGELAFRHPERSLLVEVVQGTPELDYTDDTAMALGVAESLLEKGVLDQQHLGETFQRNF
ncbi:MAG: ADP-ribosylglycohydrolase family protein, partial [Desulfoferrobacter sp.]